MNFKFQLGDHMVRAGFLSGYLIPAHMLLFKHLKARLGLLCLTAFTIFIDLKKCLPGRDQHLSSWSWRSGCCRERPTSLASFPLCLCLFAHEFTDRDGPLFLSLLHFFFPGLLCPTLPSYSRLRSSLICAFWKPVVCLNTTCALFNPLLSLLTTNMFCLHITNGYMGMLNYW